MLTGTSVQADGVTAAAIVAAAVVLAVVLATLQRALELRWARPQLPVEDRPPAGLGRLVPVGAQIDQEYRRGVGALEHWLLSTARHTGRGGG